MTEQSTDGPPGNGQGGPPALASIIVLAGENAGRTYRVDQAVTIGRSADAHVFVVGGDVSRQHARIDREGERFFVLDLGSRNGTRVNGVPIEGRVEIQFGDRITIGTSAILLFTRRDRLEEQFLQAQKMESLGRLAGGIAHDFNNLLGSVLTNLDYLRGLEGGVRLGTPEVASALADSAQAIRHAARLTRRLVGFAAQGRYQDLPTDLASVAGEVVRLLRRSVPRSISLSVDADPGCVVIGDPTQIHQVVMNLAINACDAMKEGGTLTVRVKPGEDDPAVSPSHLLAHRPHVVLEVEDTGIGMDDQTRARVFEPFFTTKKPGDGTGLGLSLVYGIVRNHGGDVQVESEVGRRTLFRLYLPAADSAQTDAEQRTETPLDEQVGATILVVDDDDLFRTGAARLLKHLGYQVIEASSGSEALELYREGREAISAVLLDLKMPEMSGEETFEALIEIDPEVRILVVSGFTNEARAQAIVDSGARAFLQKPFDANSLRKTLAATMS